MENKMKLKPLDKVLVRNTDEDRWQIALFMEYEECNPELYSCCLITSRNQCIPYKGNEHLMNTANMPEITDLKSGILFGIELKVGYVLEFNNFSHDTGVVIPTTEGLGIIFHGGGWEYLVNIYPDKVENIRDIIDKGSLVGGKLLWQKHNK